MMRWLLVAAAVVVVACSPPESPLPKVVESIEALRANGFDGTMCVSTQTFPPHAGSDRYRLRFRFSR